MRHQRRVVGVDRVPVVQHEHRRLALPESEAPGGPTAVDLQSPVTGQPQAVSRADPLDPVVTFVDERRHQAELRTRREVDLDFSLTMYSVDPT